MEHSLLPTSSNKVTVECFDPSGQFPTFKSQILRHLPLRNLHWKSTNRPIRSIDTLHVDLIAKDGTDPAIAPERRHQIPGLRQTPYLRIFLLRCDNNDAYKATSRKQLKEWVKSHPLPGESKGLFSTHENHDACEWLIVHLVHPDTPAAAQSGISKERQLGSTDSTDSITKSKWTGKSSSTIVERLRTDFNRSAKTKIDRVTQISVLKGEEKETGDMRDQYHDVVEKLKSTILASFDLRVRQYEDDIKEKDSQRNLPGWNFNTFFILKEGLAKGFEHVGLFEDALVGYDELALGLELIVEEQSKPETADHGGKFLPFGPELKEKIEACLKDASGDNRLSDQNGYDSDVDPAARFQRRNFTLDANSDAFRDLILSNNISIFDFRLYIFSRQLNLLLRSANAFSVNDDVPSSNRADRKEHFLPLAEACQRAIDFITNAARSLRKDLGLALGMGEDAVGDQGFREAVASNYITSWTYSSALQILHQTSSPNLELPQALSSDAPATPAFNAPSPMPALSPAPSGMAPPWSPFRGAIPIKLGLHERPIERLTVRKGKTGAEELAGARGELYSLAKTAVESIGRQRAWKSPAYSPFEAMEDVSLDSDEADSTKVKVMNGIQNQDLRNICQSRDAFRSLVSSLATLIYRHFITAKRAKAVERALGEMAVLKFEAGEYDVAASYFNSVIPSYSHSRWTNLETTSLAFYAESLKNLGRYGEYVSNLLKLLGQPRLSLRGAEQATTDQYLSDLWAYSAKLTTPLTAKLDDFFAIQDLKPHIHHHPDRDGFYVSLMLKFRHGPCEVADGMQMTLVALHDTGLPSIVVKTGPLSLKSQAQEVTLQSNVSVPGAWYGIDSLQIKIGNVTFREDYGHLRLLASEETKAGSFVSLRFFVYPSQRCYGSASVLGRPSIYLSLDQCCWSWRRGLIESVPARSWSSQLPLGFVFVFMMPRSTLNKHKHNLRF